MIPMDLRNATAIGRRARTLSMLWQCPACRARPQAPCVSIGAKNRGQPLAHRYVHAGRLVVAGLDRPERYTVVYGNGLRTSGRERALSEDRAIARFRRCRRLARLLALTQD